MNETMEEWIKNLTNGNGWWKEDSENTFNGMAVFLSSKGLEDDNIKIVLGSLFYAVSAEYGN